MIPLRDVIPSRTFPAVTVLLIALGLLTHLLQPALAGDAWPHVVRQFGVVPAALHWRDVLTSMFIHEGWLHLASNLVVLWIFGDNVEDRMGHGRFLVFYLLCGTLVALAHAAMEPRSVVPAIGSSGAVAGVMGAYFRMYRRSRVLTLVPILLVVQIVEVPAILFPALWAVVQLLAGPGTAAGSAYAGAVGGLSPVALLAGFAAGAVLVRAFRRAERVRVEWWNDRRPTLDPAVTNGSGSRGRRGPARS